MNPYLSQSALARHRAATDNRRLLQRLAALAGRPLQPRPLPTYRVECLDCRGGREIEIRRCRAVQCPYWEGHYRKPGPGMHAGAVKRILNAPKSSGRVKTADPA